MDKILDGIVIWHGIHNDTGYIILNKHIRNIDLFNDILCKMNPEVVFEVFKYIAIIDNFLYCKLVSINININLISDELILLEKNYNKYCALFNTFVTADESFYCACSQPSSARSDVSDGLTVSPNLEQMFCQTTLCENCNKIIGESLRHYDIMKLIDSSRYKKMLKNYKIFLREHKKNKNTLQIAIEHYRQFLIGIFNK